METSSRALHRQVSYASKAHPFSGAWGCFDEFNRITVEVLSVIAVQVKCIQDGIKEETPTFDFMGEVGLTNNSSKPSVR